MEDNEVEYEQEKISIGEFSFYIHTVSYLPIHILMQNQSKGIEISGQKLWCGSLVLSQYIHDHVDIIANKTVIELGAGTGLLGMLCYRIGCNTVILSDYDNRSIDHMIKDCNTNGIKANVVQLNWFTFDINDCNDIPMDHDIVIVAGDVLYKSSLLVPFFNVVSQFMSITSVRVQLLLCHIPRADVNHEDVITHINLRGFKYEIVDSSDWRKGFCVELSPSEDYDRAVLYKIFM